MNSPVPMAPPMAIMLIWPEVSWRLRPSSRWVISAKPSFGVVTWCAPYYCDCSICLLPQTPCGRGLAGDSSLSVEAWVTDPPPSGASPLPQGSVVFIHCVSDASSVWEGACPRWRCVSRRIRTLIQLYREQAPSSIVVCVYSGDAVAHLELRLVPGAVVEDVAEDFHGVPYLAEI